MMAIQHDASRHDFRKRTRGWRRLAYRFKSASLGTLGVLLFFATWEIVPRLLGANPLLLPPPSQVIRTLAELSGAGTLPGDVLTSVREYVVGFLGACLVGVSIGAVAGRQRMIEWSIDPFVWLLYSTPLISVYPLLIVWFGLGFGTVVAIAFLLAVIPIIINTIAGFKSVDDHLVRVATSFGLEERHIIRKVVLPSALPLILAGVRIASGRALTGVIIGEMFGANAGIGYRITAMAARIRLAEVFAYLLVVVVFGLMVTQLARFAEERLLGWRP